MKKQGKILFFFLLCSQLLIAQPIKIFFGGGHFRALDTKAVYEAKFGAGNVDMYIVTDPAQYPTYDTVFSNKTNFSQYDIVIWHDIVDIFLKITPAHVAGLISFIQQGGHAVLSLEGNTVSGIPEQAMEKIWNDLTGQNIGQSPMGAQGTRNPPRFHPSAGPWGLSPTPALSLSTQSYANFYNVHPLHVTHQRDITAPDCNNIDGVNIVYPVYPAIGQGTLYMTGEYAYPYSTSGDADYNAHMNALVNMHHTLITANATLLNQLNTWVANDDFVTVDLGNDTMMCSGGTPSYLLQASFSANHSYQWSTGATTHSITATTSNIYQITVTGSTGCTATDAVEITFGSIDANFVKTDVTCAGAADGSITITPVAGEPPFLFSINNGAMVANGSFNNLSGGNYTVVIEDNTGCRLTENIIINEPLPLILNVNAQDASCFNACDAIATAQTTGGTAPFNYTWSSNVLNPINNNAADLCAGNYSGSVEDNNGCTATTTFTIAQPQPLSIGLSIDSMCVNSNEVVNIAANATGGSGNYIIHWNHQNQNTTGATQNFTIATNAVIMAYAEDDNSCISDTQTAYIFTNPETEISLSDTAGCKPFSLQLSASNTTVGDIFSWTLGDGTTASTNMLQHIYTQHGSYNISLHTTTTAKCSGTTTAIITVYDAPEIIVTANDACANDTVFFTANAVFSGAGVVTQWQWNFGDGNVSALQNPVHVYTTNGSYNVSVTAQTDMGCPGVATIMATAHPLPVANFSSEDICFDAQPFFFNNNSSISSGQITAWQWNFSDGNMSIAENPQHTFVSAGNYDVQLVVTSGKGCVDTALGTINILPVPVAGFSVQNICIDEWLTIEDMAQPASNISYQWSLGDGNTAVVSSPAHLYNATGSYSITQIVTLAQCADTTTQTVTIYPKPVIAFTANKFSGIVDSTATFSFTNESELLASWNWNFGDGNITAELNPVHVYTDTGKFTVTLSGTSEFGCYNELAKENYITVFEKPVLYIPNAFSPNGDGNNDVFFIYGSGIKEIHFNIFDRWGEKVFETSQLLQGWDGYANGKSVNQGVYVYHAVVRFNTNELKKVKGTITLFR